MSDREMTGQEGQQRHEPAVAYVLEVALLPLEDVCRAFGVKKSLVYDWVDRRLLTRPIRLSSRCARWPAGELRAVLLARTAGHSEAQLALLVHRLEAARVHAMAAPDA